MANFTATTRELSLQEMLADPIVRAVMTRDGVTKEDVAGLLATVRCRMAGGRMAVHETARHVSGTIALEG